MSLKCMSLKSGNVPKFYVDENFRFVTAVQKVLGVA